MLCINVSGIQNPHIGEECPTFEGSYLVLLRSHYLSVKSSRTLLVGTQ